MYIEIYNEINNDESNDNESNENEVMIMRVMIRLRFNYRSILKEYPLGIEGRHKEADKFIAAQGNPRILTYYDHYYNIELKKDYAQILPNSTELNELSSLRSRVNVGLVRMEDLIKFISFPQRGDDELVQDIEGKTLYGFVKECLDRDKCTPVHHVCRQFALTLLLGTISYIFYHSLEKNNAVRDSGELTTQLSYNPREFAIAIKHEMPRIQFLNRHLTEQLEKAKKKSKQSDHN